ncbi:MAG TPA: HNH endonuclease [Candidatus Bathyarchaeota archaeon]|nr:HNH endonuclease [Candidatus Bathyarchaeota archaeon]
MRRFANKRERDLSYLLQDGLCAICSQPLPESFEMDHLVPFSERGDTKCSNLQALCKACHLEKTRAMVRSKSSTRCCLPTS